MVPGGAGSDTESGSGETGSSTDEVPGTSGSPTGDPTSSTSSPSTTANPSSPTTTCLGECTDTWGTDTGSPPVDPNDPPQVDFAFIGAPIESDDAFGECLYRWRPDGVPQPLWCPEANQHILEGWLPPPGSAFGTLLVEEAALDLYPIHLYRFDIHGDILHLGTVGGWPNGGPRVEAVKAVALPDGGVVVEQRIEVLGEPVGDKEIRVVDEDLTQHGDLLPTHQRKGLVDVADDGRVVILAEPGDLYWVDPSTAETELVSTDVRPAIQGPIAAQGSLLFATAELGGGSTVHWQGATMPSEIDAQTQLLGPSPLGILFIDEPLLMAWDGTTKQPPQVLQRVGGAFVDGGEALVAYEDGDVGFVTGFGEGHAAAFLDPSGTLELCQGGEFYIWESEGLTGDAGPVMLLSESDQGDAPIHSCRPGGTPVDVLTDHGMRGRLLERSWTNTLWQ